MRRQQSRPFTGFLPFVVAVLVAAACSTGPVAPTPSGEPTVATGEPLAMARADDLGACDTLAAPAGSQLARRLYAEGVQIYRWNGAAWAFVAPEAELFANERAEGVVGTHYAGPTWELRSGSLVKAAVLKRCTPDQGAIPWLLLGVTVGADHGVLTGVTHIQRVATAGGLALGAPGSVIGEERRVPYTAVYLFFRAPRAP